MKDPENKPAEKIETKQVRHDYTDAEKASLGGELSRAIGALRTLEAEFDEVKASYKAKTAEAQTKVERISTQLMNGWELRQSRCRVVFRPRDRKKDFMLEEDWNEFGAEAHPVLTEDMTQDDFQAELIQAESAFEARDEIPLFPPAGDSSGVLIVGRLNGRWFSALRIKIGGHALSERLDSEQVSSKARFDAVRRGAKRATSWLKETLGAESAEGFENPIREAVEAHRERVE